MKRLFPLISVFCALICIQFCEGAATSVQNPDRHSIRTSAISENEPDVQSLSVPRGTEKKLRTSGYRSSRAGPLRKERPLCTSSTARVENEPIKRIHVAPVRITKNRKQDGLGSTDASATDKPPRKVRYVYKRRRIANQVDKPADKKNDKVDEAQATTPAPASSPAPEVSPVPGNKSEEVAEVEKKPEEKRPVYKKKGSSTPPPPSSTLNPEEFSEESNKDDLGDPSLFPKQNEEKSTTEEKNTLARGKGQAKSVLNNPSNLKPLNQQGSMETTEAGSVANDKIGKVEVDKAAQEDKKTQRSEKRRKNRRTSARQQQSSTASNERLSRRRSNNDEGET